MRTSRLALFRPGKTPHGAYPRVPHSPISPTARPGSGSEYGASLSSHSSPIGSGGMKFRPAGITALHELEQDGTPIVASGKGSFKDLVTPNPWGNLAGGDADDDNSARLHSQSVVDSAALPTLAPEDRAERARRLRHYRPVTLAMREKIVDDSPHKTYHRITPDNGFGERVDDYLLRLHPDWSADTIRRLSESGLIYRYTGGKKIYCRLTDRLHNGEFLVVPTKDMFAPTEQEQEGGAAADEADDQQPQQSRRIFAPPSGDVYETLRTNSGEAAQQFREAADRRKEIHLSYKVKQEALDWVLFKNQYVVVINKPSGIPVTKTKDGSLNVSDMLPAWKFTQKNRPLILNHLDQESSGIVVLARARRSRSRWSPRVIFWVVFFF